VTKIDKDRKKKKNKIKGKDKDQISKTESVLGDDPLKWLKAENENGDEPVDDNQDSGIKKGIAGDVVAVEFPDMEDLTIRNVSKLYEQFSELLKTNEPLQVSLQQVQYVDTAGIQLLIAFQAACIKRDKLLEWKEPSVELTQMLGLLGFGQDLGMNTESES